MIVYASGSAARLIDGSSTLLVAIVHIVASLGAARASCAWGDARRTARLQRPIEPRACHLKSLCPTMSKKMDNHICLCESAPAYFFRSSASRLAVESLAPDHTTVQATRM